MIEVQLNDKAPDFMLVDQNINKVHLRELLHKGRVLIAFFPGAFTGVCTKEMCMFRDNMKNFNSFRINVVGICVNDPFTNKAFSIQNQLNFPILSDYTREISRRYGVVHEDFAGLPMYTAAKRAVFIINKDGIVRYKWVSDDPSKEPPYEKINSTISSK